MQLAATVCSSEFTGLLRQPSGGGLESGRGTGAIVNDLPEFEDPPVIEVALSAQFRALPGLQGLALAPLRELWRAQYPQVEEQPPLPSIVEGDIPGGPSFQLNLGFPAVRYWFLTDDGMDLVQLQYDRLSVNWRELGSGNAYPRYPAMRQVFADRFTDLRHFTVAEGLGDLHVTQLELSYINAVTVDHGDMGKLERILSMWRSVPNHHLDDPEQVRAELTYQVKGLGAGVSRLWAQVGPGQREAGVPAILLTFSLRGAPAGEGLDGALAFLDDAHQHVVRSFAELTTAEMHANWRLRP
jgi:uncharacterized protein (TIGR04255 family)